MNFGSYKAKRNDKGHLIIENVPIFVECKRGDTHFSDEWIATAVSKAKQAELEGYLPPLHIRHHGDDSPVEPAGYFRIRGAGPITFKGKTRTAVFADLVVTRPWVEDDVLAARLPYRSVEIFDVDDPAINSLALLDHEPPYLELPMLMVEEPSDWRTDQDGVSELPIPTSGTLVRVAGATFANPWQSSTYKQGDPVVACFRRGHSAHLFIEDTEHMSTTKTKPTAPKGSTKTSVKFADDYEKKDGEEMADEKDEDKSEDMEDGEAGLDVAAVCKAIADGSITVADMEAIKAAIVAQMSDVGAETETEEAPAPAPTPGEAMKNDPTKSAKFAAMQAKLDAQEAKLAEMERQVARKEAVDEAMLRLEGRPLGADPAAKFGKRFDELGAQGFKLYVDDLASMFGKMPTSATSKANAFAGQDGVSEVVLAYTDQGAEASEKAAKFSAEHRELVRHNATRHDEASYVRSNMVRAGFKAPKTN